MISVSVKMLYQKIMEDFLRSGRSQGIKVEKSGHPDLVICFLAHSEIFCPDLPICFLVKLCMRLFFLCYWAIPENIHPLPLWTTPNWVPKNFRISKKDNCSFCRIPEPADSKSWGIPEFCKNLNGFPGIPVKIYKILGKFLDRFPVILTEYFLQDF